MVTRFGVDYARVMISITDNRAACFPLLIAKQLRIVGYMRFTRLQRQLNVNALLVAKYSDHNTGKPISMQY